MSAPSFSVVIPTYARPADLERCLDALADQTEPPLEILVVDDGSDPPYAPALAERFPGVRALQQHREGPGKARLWGAREARGDVVALCDDDVVPPPGWLAAAARCWRADTVALEGRVTQPPDVSPRDARVQHNPGGGYLTCNLFVRRDVLLDCAPDPRFVKPFREDTDVALQILERHGPIGFCPEAVLTHPTAPLAFRKLLETAWWHTFDGLIVRRHGAATDAIGVLRLPGGRAVVRPKQRLAVAQLTLTGAALVTRRRPLVAAAALVTVVANGWEQRYWVRSALEHDRSRLRDPRRWAQAVGQGAEQSAANLVRGAAYLVGRARWSRAPRDAPRG